MAAKSATVADAMMVWPMWPSASPASLSTGTTSPSEVADNAIAIRSGDMVQPTAPSPADRYAKHECDPIAQNGEA